MAQDLYYILANITKGDATVTVRNFAKRGAEQRQDGLRAWRALKAGIESEDASKKIAELH